MKWMECFFAILMVIAFAGGSSARETDAEPFAAFYFHGTGCSHCKNVDLVLFPDWLMNSTSLVVIEYEVYQDRENSLAMNRFNEQYGIGTGIPVLFIDQSTTLRGDRTILSETQGLIEECEINSPYCRQNTIPFESLDLTSLPGHPRIWYRDRVLILQSPGGDGDALQRLLVGTSVSESLNEVPHSRTAPIPIQLSGQNLTFQNAVQLEGGTFQWNAPELPELQGDAQDPASEELPARRTPLMYAPGLALMFLIVVAGMRKRLP